MRVIPLLGAALLAIVLFSACSSGAAAPQPVTPTPDVPVLDQYEVWGALRMHVIALSHKNVHGAVVGCAATEARYQGSGLWHCGTWVLNERTGDVMPDDGSSRLSGHVHLP